MWYENFYTVVGLIVFFLGGVMVLLDWFSSEKHEKQKEIMKLQHKHNIEMENVATNMSIKKHKDTSATGVEE